MKRKYQLLFPAVIVCFLTSCTFYKKLYLSCDSEKTTAQSKNQQLIIENTTRINNADSLRTQNEIIKRQNEKLKVDNESLKNDISKLKN